MCLADNVKDRCEQWTGVLLWWSFKFLLPTGQVMCNWHHKRSLDHDLALCSGFVMHQPTESQKENSQHDFDVAEHQPCTWWPRVWWISPLMVVPCTCWVSDMILWWLYLAFRVVLRKYGSWFSQLFQTSCFWSIVNSFGMNYVGTAHGQNFKQDGVYWTNICPHQKPHLNVPEWCHNGSAWTKSALAQWPHYFGLQKAYWKLLHFLPICGHSMK